jgi:ech hydrogenase subunit D
MREEQPNVAITPDKLVAEVKARRDQGWRLVQIGVTGLGESLEVNYSFDLEQRFCNLRFTIPAAGARLPSVSSVYWCAFLYENEIHDLFNITFDGMAIDFKGNFYQTSKPFPFAQATPGVSTSVVQPPV